LISRLQPPPTSTLFPYTTLFRSRGIATTFRLRKSEATAEMIIIRDSPCRSLMTKICWSWSLTEYHSSKKSFPYLFCLKTASTLRSEEHTSELQSRFDLVCRLLLE